jgi:hypothetical protein
MASVYYTAFGLSLCADQPLPGLVARPAAGPIDVQINLGAMPPGWEKLGPDDPDQFPWYASPGHDAPGVPTLVVRRRSQGRFFHLRYGDATEFAVERNGTKVWATWPATATLADTTTYLLGPVLGLVLRLHGLVCLHASVVALDGQALALFGLAGAGKSTLAAAFARRGAVVLTDDIAVLEMNGAAFRVRPAFPQLRLWPESVRLLFGHESALQPLTPNWEKRGLDLTRPEFRFAEKAAPLAAIYLLGDRRAENAPCIEELPQAGRLVTLAHNTYVNYLLDRQMRAAEFQILGRLVAATPMRRAVAHTDPERVLDLCSAIIEDWRSHDQARACAQA